MVFYSQLDPKWASITIGNTTLKLGRFGLFIFLVKTCFRAISPSPRVNPYFKYFHRLVAPKAVCINPSLFSITPSLSKPLMAMHFPVIFYINKFKIFNSVIELIPIKMMDMFIATKDTAKMLRHNISVLKIIFPIDKNLRIALSVLTSSSIPSPMSLPRMSFNLLFISRKCQNSKAVASLRTEAERIFSRYNNFSWRGALFTG